MKLLWLADVLRAAGQQVQEVPGWETRGRPYSYYPHGVLWHHTAGPEFEHATSRTPSLHIVIEGRAGIPGPLSQTLLAPDGTWYVVAAGYANHAGRGSYPGINRGNPELLGVEAEESGDGDWVPVQLEALREGTAAIMDFAGWDLLLGHKEWAPTRKVDPAGLNMDQERALIRKMIEEVDMMELDRVQNSDLVKRFEQLLADAGIMTGNHPDTAAVAPSLLKVTLGRVVRDQQKIFQKLEALEAEVEQLGLEGKVVDIEELAESIIDEIITRLQNPD